MIKSPFERSCIKLLQLLLGLRTLSMGKKRQQLQLWKKKKAAHTVTFSKVLNIFFSSCLIRQNKSRAADQLQGERGRTKKLEVERRERKPRKLAETIMLSWSIHWVFYAFCMCYFIIMYYEVQLVAMVTYQLFNCEHQCGLGGPFWFIVFYIIKWRGRKLGRMKTHQILCVSSGPDPEVVPQEEQNQGQGQHVGVPVPDGQHENLQTRRQKWNTSPLSARSEQINHNSFTSLPDSSHMQAVNRRRWCLWPHPCGSGESKLTKTFSQQLGAKRGFTGHFGG